MTVDGSAVSSTINITGNKKKNYIIAGANGSTLNGGKGKDSLIGGAGNDTLWGGKGNDSLWGGEGANTFRYSKGDGKDVIFGFDDDDFLEISETFKPTYNVDKEEIALKVGSGSVTFREFSATNFNINGETWQLTNGVFSKKE